MLDKMSDIQQDLHGEKVVNSDLIIIKYDGPSFDKNKMELPSFTKQIYSVEKLLKESIKQLSKNQKIKDEPQQPKLFIQLRKSSFETALLIIFSNSIMINILSDCIFSYLKYLATGILNKDYKREIENLTNNKTIRNSTRNIINPCIENEDKATIINGDVNFNNCNILLELDKGKRDNIYDKLDEIEESSPIEQFEQEMFGKILEIDAVKNEEQLSKSRLCFVVEGGNEPIEALFNADIKKEEIKKIIFERIKIKANVSYKGDDMIKILIKSYYLSQLKNLKEFIRNAPPKSTKTTQSKKMDRTIQKRGL